MFDPIKRYGKTWESAPLGHHNTREEAEKDAVNVRRGGYHAIVVRVPNTLGFHMVRARNGKVTRKVAPYDYVVYRRWDKEKYPAGCNPHNMLGRRRG